MNGYSQAPTSRSFTLRELPLAARLTLALFLISVGIGYMSALVQLHFQHASPGALLPTPDDAVRVFFGQTGDKPKSKIEQLLPELDQGPFNGSGQMTSAFTKRSEDLKKASRERTKILAKKEKTNPNDPVIQETAEAEVRKERDLERLTLLAWIHAGANEKEYNDDAFPLPAELADRPLTSNYLVAEDGKVAEPRMAKIKSILQDR